MIDGGWQAQNTRSKQRVVQIRSIGARRHSDSYVIESYKIPYINELYEAVVCAVNHYPFDNG